MINRTIDLNSLSSSNMNVIFEALPYALLILKTDAPFFTVEEMNKAFIKLSGIESSDLKDKPFFETINNYTSENYQDSLDDIYSTVKEVISDKKVVETDVMKLNLSSAHPLGKSDLYVQIKCAPVLNNTNGNVDTVVLAVDDLTDLFSAREKSSSDSKKTRSRKELQIISKNLVDRAADSNAQYQSASQELDDFVYSVSHDLRAPLRRIDGFSQELLNEYTDKLDETGVHYLKRVRQGAQDMGQLIDDLLKLSRISRKKVEKEQVDLGKVAKSVFEELMEMEPERNISFRLDEELEVYADKGLLKAMITNLLSNALKFTSNKKNAEIHVGSKIVDGEEVFFISDNGVGFDPAYSDKLFKAFSRLHSHNQFSGTGIGLATVKRIMTLHGGAIWAESSEDEGATFYFKF